MECVTCPWLLIVFVVCLSQSLLLVVVGFTFSDEEVPADFEPQYDNWLGESIESVEDWRTGPFYQHFPPQKGTFEELLISLLPRTHRITWCKFLYFFHRGSHPQTFQDPSSYIHK